MIFFEVASLVSTVEILYIICHVFSELGANLIGIVCVGVNLVCIKKICLNPSCHDDTLFFAFKGKALI